MQKLFSVLTLMVIIFSVSAEEITNPYSYERYKVLYERNIYLKKRLSQPELLRHPQSSILKQTPVVTRKVLTGIVDEGAEYIAFFEDPSLKKIERVRKGDTILNKTIESITLDYVEYVENGKKNIVKVGESIASVISTPGLEASTDINVADYERPRAVEIVTSDTIKIIDKLDEETVLERLRLRRQRELQ